MFKRKAAERFSGRLISRNCASGAGSTLVEAMIACAIVSLFFGTLYSGSCRCLHMLQSANEGTSASQLLANLQEQMRTATWAEMTDPTYLSGTILANSAATGHLSNVTQAIVVNPYPIPTGYSGSPQIGGQTIEVTRNSSGAVTTAYSGNGQLPSQTAIRADITVNWTTAFSSAPQTRMLSLILSPGGVVGQN